MDKPKPFSWSPHLVAIIGPLILWAAFYFTKARGMDLFGSNIGPMMMGVIPGMSFGYFVCVLKMKPKKKKPEEPTALKDLK